MVPLAAADYQDSKEQCRLTDENVLCEMSAIQEMGEHLEFGLWATVQGTTHTRQGVARQGEFLKREERNRRSCETKSFEAFVLTSVFSSEQKSLNPKPKCYVKLGSFATNAWEAMTGKSESSQHWSAIGIFIASDSTPQTFII